MYRIASGQPPAGFTTFRRTSGARYSDLDSAVKDELRDFLLTAQSGRCAYCERDIRKATKTKIEHFHPQHLPVAQGSSTCEQRTGIKVRGRAGQSADLAPGNLLLCCDGNEGPLVDQTCDSRKGSTHICDDIENPKQLPSHVASVVEVESDGTVRAARAPSSGTTAQAVIDDVLGLNHPWLVQQRRSVLAVWKRKFGQVQRSRGQNSMAAARKDFAQLLRKTATTSAYPSTLESLAARTEAGKA